MSSDVLTSSITIALNLEDSLYISGSQPVGNGTLFGLPSFYHFVKNQNLRHKCHYKTTKSQPH